MSEQSTNDDTYLSAQAPAIGRDRVRERNRRSTDPIDDLVRLDGRSPLGRQIREFRDELISHIGGGTALSPVQRLIIGRRCELQTRCLLLDNKFRSTGEMTQHDRNSYLAFSSALIRSVKTLGMKSAAPAPNQADTLAGIIADVRASKARQAPDSTPTPVPAPDAPRATTAPLCAKAHT